MKNDRQMNMFPYPGMMPMNQMMNPNFMNEGFQNFENRMSNIEKRIKNIENRIERLENPYGTTNTQTYQNTITNTQTETMPYQTTQNNAGYNGEMYMM